MKILILSAGTRNLVMRAFRETMDKDDRLLAADCSPYAPALYEADEHFLVPRLNEPGYLDKILSICRKEKVDAALSLIDPELSVLAAHREEFQRAGTRVIVSPYSLVEACLHKLRLLEKAREMGYPVVETYTSRLYFQSARVAGRIDFPVFVKPEDGSASININLVNSMEELDVMLKTYPGLIIQEYMQAQEIGVDAYIDLISGKCVSIFSKKKLKMRAGETDKSVSFKDPALFSLVTEFVERMGFRGMIDIDLFIVTEFTTFPRSTPALAAATPTPTPAASISPSLSSTTCSISRIPSRSAATTRALS